VVGGLRVTEPAVDLAVAAAIASSARSRAIPDDLVILGEIGLSGELRSVAQTGRRLSEACSLGFRRAIVPRAPGEQHTPAGIETLAARTVGGGLELTLDA
jgi:DNA repair protein RadA/Sms